jgi:uncharacterized protein YaeQ
MALKATIYKADLNIANMDVHQYGDYQLTLALHPSETIERLMVRLLAFARFAHGEHFTAGLDLVELQPKLTAGVFDFPASQISPLVQPSVGK